MENRTTTERAFGCGQPIKLENGRTITVKKWSVRKAARMGRAITNLVQSFFAVINRLKTQEYVKAQEIAEGQGLKEGDEGWPNRADYEDTRIEEIMTAVPELLELATEDLAKVIAGSIEEEDVNADYVLDEFTFEHDFPNTIEVIAKTNLTEKTVKKWMGLLSGQTWMGQSKNTR